MDDATPPTDWDQRYLSSDRVWSGQPNGALVGEIASITPGRVLDVGCGEGTDAIWLAERGWDVVAIDVSEVAIERAESAARSAGVTVGFSAVGLLDLALPEAGFDLVSVQYPALLRTPGSDVEHRLLEAVAPGGTLLVVHHADVDRVRALAHGFDPDDNVSHDDLLAMLRDPQSADGWHVEVSERRPRQITGGGGSHHHDDLVLRARRLA